MKLFFQLIDRLGEWILLTGMFVLTSTLTLGVGVGVSYLALVKTLWRLPSDHQGYVVRNYWGHFRRGLKTPTILKTVLILTLTFLNTILATFLLSLPPALIVSVLIIGQLVSMVYLWMVVLIHALIAPLLIKPLLWEQALLLPIRYPLLSLLVLLSTSFLLLPIYGSFAFVFIILPVIVEIQIWLGKKVVNIHEKISPL
jgi:hypothetical protein